MINVSRIHTSACPVPAHRRSLASAAQPGTRKGRR